MRIISGSARGRKLLTPTERQKGIRPTSDRAREALFSIIGLEVVDARVLDLFAGTGALGCEALSRGAHSAVFIDNSKTALELIRKNISLISKNSRSVTIIRHNLKKGLGLKLKASENDLQFDLVFADPPYQKGFSEIILHCLDNCAVLSKKVLVIIEEKKDVVLPDMLQNLVAEDSRSYGDTNFVFYRLKKTLTSNLLE